MMQGSASTGRKFKAEKLGSYAEVNPRFDIGKQSDYDVALVSQELFESAKAAGAYIRGPKGGSRTGALSVKNQRMAEKLGLKELQDTLSKQVGRDVNFMIFKSTDAAMAKNGLSIVVR